LFLLLFLGTLAQRLLLYLAQPFVPHLVLLEEDVPGGHEEDPLNVPMKLAGPVVPLENGSDVVDQFYRPLDHVVRAAAVDRGSSLDEFVPGGRLSQLLRLQQAFEFLHHPEVPSGTTPAHRSLKSTYPS